MLRVVNVFNKMRIYGFMFSGWVLRRYWFSEFE